MSTLSASKIKYENTRTGSMRELKPGDTVMVEAMCKVTKAADEKGHVWVVGLAERVAIRNLAVQVPASVCTIVKRPFKVGDSVLNPELRGGEVTAVGRNKAIVAFDDEGTIEESYDLSDLTFLARIDA